MKPYKVVLFIFSVLLGLALLCLVFPKDGITLGSVKLEFPSLAEALSAPEPDAADDGDDDEEKKMQARLDSIKNMKDKEYVEYIKKDKARIYMPNDDLGYLDELFRQMENSDKASVRIMHYGDSQLEEDHLSCDLREHLQELFGGGGVGLLPAMQPVAKETVVQTTSPELERRCAYGLPETRGSNNNYGPMAQSSHVNGNASFTFTTSDAKRFPHAGKINKVVVAMSGSGSIVAVSGGKTYTLKTESKNEGVRVYSAEMDSVSGRVTVKVNGNMEVYGISLENKTGVIVDNISMRGCSGTIFTCIRENSIAPFFSQQNVGLIILQFGGNYVSATTGNTAIEQYRKLLRNQLQMFKKYAPKAKILFIGPADMAASIHGKLQTYPCLENLIKMLREVSNEQGCAFWDMYSAMGGNGSMVKWVKAKPAMGYSDYVHFTPRGAHKMGDMLFNTVKMYYDYYKFRTQK